MRPKKRAYAIADNKIALNADWDEELLKIELEALRDNGIAIQNLGFSDEEFNRLLDELTPKQEIGEDSTPEVVETAVSQTGELWQLGDHLVLCGDALDPTCYARLLAGSSAMVFVIRPTTSHSPAKKASKARKAAKAAKPEADRHDSKTTQILDLLKRPGGAAAKELMEATGWQPHSVRGFLSGTVRKKMGLVVISTKGEDGQRSYSVEA